MNMQSYSGIFCVALILCTSTLFGQKEEHKRWMGFGEAGRTVYPLETFEDQDPLTFFVLGDWGRHGQYGQKELADVMGQVAEKIEPEFIISTGDNFYPDGVASVMDPAWQKSFEDVYTHHLLHCPWYVVLGNHDYRGNCEAQIAYTDISRRWTMPDRYFFKDYNTEDGVDARFVFIDSSPFEDKYYEEEKYKYSVSSQDSARQKRWIEGMLEGNSNTWEIVVGHHPMYSGGKRRFSTDDMKKNLEPTLKRFNVDAYFCGHEHDVQHIFPEDGVNQVISGAGSDIRETGYHPGSLFSMAEHGFVIVSLLPDRGLMQIVDGKGEVVYRYEFKPNSN